MKKEKKPFGRQEVIDALIETAADLFAQHGSSGVPIRTIASDAGVNLGLFHRHIGNKDNLYKLTLAHLANQIDADIPSGDSFAEFLRHAFESLESHDRFWRILARTLLDGMPVENMHGDYPVARHLLDLARQAAADGVIPENIDPRLIVAAMFSFALGFLLFEPFIRKATELDDLSPREIRDRIISEAMRLFLSAK